MYVYVHSALHMLHECSRRVLAGQAKLLWGLDAGTFASLISFKCGLPYSLFLQLVVIFVGVRVIFCFVIYTLPFSHCLRECVTLFSRSPLIPLDYLPAFAKMLTL